MLQRVKREQAVTPTTQSENAITATPFARKQLMENVLLAATTNKDTNRQVNIYQYIDAYRDKGEDIVKWYEQRKKTTHVDAIKDDFVHNKEHYVGARLIETLPLFANQPGRLGDYITANVTKTAKQDDQGNSFIDLVIEIHNKYLETDAPSELQDVPAKMTFLVDTTVAKDLAAKMAMLQDNYLVRGEKANVKCYKTQHGDLGIVRPKVIVAKAADYIEGVGVMLGDCITQMASDKFTISKPQKFDDEYRRYFLEMMTAIAENAEENINYMKRLVKDEKRSQLIREYEKMIKFVDAYKKTPTKRVRVA